MSCKWCHLSNCLVVTASLVAMNLPGLAQSANGKISGVVVGDDGKLLAAVVTANKVGGSVGAARAETSSDGSFVLSGLAAGTYGLCVLVKGGGYLDPCAWSAMILTVQVNAGQAVTSQRLIAKKGPALQVRLSDPGKVLDSSGGKTQPLPHVIVGVFTDKHLFQPLGLTSKDSGGRNL